jgi:hypothetical protein
MRTYAMTVWCGQGAAPTYMEAPSPRARDLYLRHGYTMRPGSAFRLPEGPLLWPMWREPRAASRTWKTAVNLDGCDRRVDAG